MSNKKISKKTEICALTIVWMLEAVENLYVSIHQLKKYRKPKSLTTGPMLQI